MVGEDTPESLSATERITLVVSTRDRATTLRQVLLPCLVAATQAGFRVILVDQSTDGQTKDLVAELPGLTYLRSEPGLSHGRNTAVAVVTTELLAFTDDDVAFPVTWLPTVVGLFDLHPGAGAVCGRARDATERMLPGHLAGTYDWPIHPFGMGSGFNMSFRAEALRAAGPFDPDLGAGSRYASGEDTDMLYRVSKAGWTIVCADGIEVVHCDGRRPRETLRLHHSYGRGAGAQTAGHVRRGDPTAAVIAVREIARHGVSFLRYAAARDAHRAMLQVTFVAGMARGFLSRLVRGPSAVGRR